MLMLHSLLDSISFDEVEFEKTFSIDVDVLEILVGIYQVI